MNLVLDKLTSAVGLRFIIVGLTMAVGYFLLFQGLHSVLGLSPLVTSILAYLISIVVSFALHRTWTFNSSLPMRRSLFRYVIVQLTCMALIAVTTHYIYVAFTLQGPAASLLATLVAGAFSFVFSLLWVFVDAKDQNQ